MEKLREWFGALKWWQKVGVVLAALFICGLLVPSADEEPAAPSLTVEEVAATEEAEAAEEAAAAETEGAEEEREAEEAAAAAAAAEAEAAELAADPEKHLRSLLEERMGNVNREGVERLSNVVVNIGQSEGAVVVVNYALNDNLTQNMRYGGALNDVWDILRSVRELNLDVPLAAVRTMGSFSMLDQYGNASEDTVFVLNFTGEAVGKINFDNILVKENLPVLADSAVIHPAMVPKD